MADAEKESQRAALHKAIWGIADEVRGAVDGWDFKMYILGFLFYRFISEDLAEFVDAGEHESGDLDFSYATLSDDEASEARDGIIEEKGYFLLPSELFANVTVHCDRDPDLNETLKSIFDHIEGSSIGTRSEKSFRGLFDDIDLNSSKLGNGVAERNQRLVKIMKGIASLDFGNIKDAKIDLFGDAYEYLMNMYASNAGKSGGEFFTPQEVSELLARIVIGDRTGVNKVYDPACGSGSLLLRFARILGQENVRRGFFGQEINITTINDARFSPAGVLAPKGKADLAFTMHMLSWLSQDGKAAIVEFPGVLYRGGAEQKIRKYMVDNNFVDTVIQLPANLFFGVTIATCIIVLSKSKKDDNVLFVDASEEFSHVGNKNKLMPGNIDRIYRTVHDRSEEEHFSKLVPIEQLGGDNNYNLSVGTWVEKRDTREKIDIHELNQRIAGIVAREQELREQIDAIVADLEA